MKVVLALVLIWVILQNLGVSLSESQSGTDQTNDTSSQSTETPAVNCSSFSSDQMQCCAAGNSSACIYFSCAVSDETVTVCADEATTPVCPEDAVPSADMCSNQTTDQTQSTPVPEVDCSSFSSDQAKCCAAGNSSACRFVNCTDPEGTVTGTVCAAEDTTPQCPTDGDTASSNICTDQTTDSPSQSTGTPAVDCSSFNSDQKQCCAAGNSSACIYFSCAVSDGTVTVCSDAGTTPVCPEDAVPSADMCAADTTESSPETPSHEPSQGDGGQSFDAASFIGGIVLCAGLMAIAFFGYKFYKSRQDRSYRSM